MEHIFAFTPLHDDERARLNGRRGAVLWFTGLSGSGKSTIAAMTERLLLEKCVPAYLLDGDNVRLGLNADLGFSREDRAENIRRLGHVAALFAHSGTICLVSAISPFAADREKAQKAAAAFRCPFVEIFVDTPLEECIRRDTKGLYAKAQKGEISEFTGVSSPYEPPFDSDIVLRTLETSPAEAASLVVGYIDALGGLPAMLPVLCAAARAAGDKIMDIYRQDFKVSYKDDRTPLTEADTAADLLIRQELSKRYPDCAVLSEESTDDPSRLKNPRCFIVDPLDGTKEFVKKNGEFTVNIAFTYGGRSIAGVVYAPAQDRLYYAAKGLGAYACTGESICFAEKDRIHVSGRLEALRIVTSRSHLDEETTALLKRNKEKIAETIGIGSSLKGCRIAEGCAEGYYRPGCTMEWDTAAMQCVVEEAGGLFLQLDDTIMRYNRINTVNDKGFYILNSADNALHNK